MKTQLLTLVTALALGASACKEPAVSSGETNSFAVAGQLMYRSACNGGVMQAFPGGAVSPFVQPDYAGRFRITLTTGGDLRLRLQAGSLHHFWLGEPLSSVAVTLEDGIVKGMGQVCADTLPIDLLSTRATWGAGDYSEAEPGQALYVSSATTVTFVAVADTDLGRQLLPVIWTETVALDAFNQVIVGTVSDGRGSFVNVAHRLHAYAAQAPAKPMGGWMDFGERVTAADVKLLWLAPYGVMTLAPDGLRATAPAGYDRVNLQAVLRATFAVTQASAVTVPVMLNTLADGAAVEAGWKTTATQLAARLTRVGAAYELSVRGADGALLAAVDAGAVPMGERAILRLHFDPATLEVAAGFGAVGTEFTATGTLPAWTAQRMTPYVALTRERALTEEAIDVAFEGLYTAEETTMVRLAAAAGELAGVVYDDVAPYYYVGGVGYMTVLGGAQVAIDGGAPLARALVLNSGRLMTIYTDLPRETIAGGVTALDAWDEEMVVRVSGGRTFLF
jgi:hypothetical protein